MNANNVETEKHNGVGGDSGEPRSERLTTNVRTTYIMNNGETFHVHRINSSNEGLAPCEGTSRFVSDDIVHVWQPTPSADEE